MKASNATMPKAEPVCYNGSRLDSASAVAGANSDPAITSAARRRLTRRFCIRALDGLNISGGILGKLIPGRHDIRARTALGRASAELLAAW
jgi:hypothetical protein